jgi:vancomycin resistance protein YoaR
MPEPAPEPEPAPAPSPSPAGVAAAPDEAAPPVAPEAQPGARPIALVAIALSAIALVAGAYVWSLRRPMTIAGLRAGGVDVGGVAFDALDGALGPVVDRVLDEKIVLVAGGSERRSTRRELGVVVDRERLKAAIVAAGRSGWPIDDLLERARARRGRLDLAVPLDVDRKRAVEVLAELKDEIDRAPVDAHLDLERHTIAPEIPGALVRVYDAVAALEYAARGGAARVELPVLEAPPRVRAKDLEGIDISTVLGAWETRYSASQTDTDRTYNLKVGADKLNGHILKPAEVFSFNEVVGDRTEKEGYRVAPVIQAGELVDGLAGGMCQIASTLHAAAFFAGLDIVSSTPHSRPSVYIPMGLDSTVVYPTVDLKLKNPYDFPIVMHYTVSQGSVKVELLGKARPRRVVFEREIKTETGFGTQVRRDPTAPAGQKLVLQEGYPGYTLVRRRYIFDESDPPPKAATSGTTPVAEALQAAKKKPLAKEQWALHYPATTQIVAIGSGPASLKKKEPPPSHKIPPLKPSDKPIFKIFR